MINKYQAGGATQGSILQEIAKLPKEQQKKIMTAFGKWAQAKGLNIQQLQGNEQALEQAMGQFLQEMSPKARLGAKINYIRELKGNAPEGMEVEYYKCGGQMKKRFVKAAGGEKVKDGRKEIEDFKKRKACGGFKTKLLDGGETPEKPKKEKSKKEEKPTQRLDPRTTKKLPGGKYPEYWTSKERQIWERLHGDNDEGAAVVENKGIGNNKNGGLLFPVFQQGGSFKNAFNLARKNKQRYFNWTDAKGVTRMYNSKASENDAEYETFVDNMNEMSAQLPTDRSPKHLGWERNNPTSNELRGGDRQIGYQGTESMLPEVVVIGTRKPKTTKTTKKTPQYKVVYNMPMGAIEYVGRDGKQYWMRQDHSTGQYYYIDRGKPISYAKTAVPEGYIIPGTNIKITRGANIGKIGLGLQKKWLKDGGSIPYYQAGTPKGGITEKSDNTRVARVINNGEGVPQRTPQDWMDFLPVVGTLRAANRIDHNEPNASYGDLAMNAGMDLLGAKMLGTFVKAAGRVGKAMKTAKSLGYKQYTKHTPVIPASQKSGTQLLKIDASKMVKPQGSYSLKQMPNTVMQDAYLKTPYGTAHVEFGRPVVSTRTIPELDYTLPAMLPLVETLRIPATAPFK